MKRGFRDVRFSRVPGSGGRESACQLTHRGYRFRVVRFRNGQLTAFLRASHGRGLVAVSHRPTRDLQQLVEDSVAFIRLAGKGV